MNDNAMSVTDRILEWLRNFDNGEWSKDGADIGIMEAEEVFRAIIAKAERDRIAAAE